jgi:hypothetical protein
VVEAENEIKYDMNQVGHRWVCGKKSEMRSNSEGEGKGIKRRG